MKRQTITCNENPCIKVGSVVKKLLGLYTYLIYLISFGDSKESRHELCGNQSNLIWDNDSGRSPISHTPLLKAASTVH